MTGLVLTTLNIISGYIVHLKSAYFEKKDPIDDNEIVLQKLCIKLETALRHGMKGKKLPLL